MSSPSSSSRPCGSNPIQLYSLGTPNGLKISIALEELGLPYDAHTIDIRKNEHLAQWFIDLNPNVKIPVLVDHNGPNGQELVIFESGAILLYLAEKTGKLIPSDPVKRYDVIQWLFWQMAGLGPMLGQYGHFTKYAPEKVEYGINRYTNEAKRLLGVLEARLNGRQWIAGDEYSIADIACYGWILGVQLFYKTWSDLGSFPNIDRWAKEIGERPATVRGREVNKP